MVLSFDRIMLLTQGRKLWFLLALPERKTGCWRKERMATAAWAVVQPGSYRGPSGSAHTAACYPKCWAGPGVTGLPARAELRCGFQK